MIKVMKYHPHAIIPTKGSPLAAGFDLYALDPVTIPAGFFAKIPTGVGFEMPPNCYGQIAPRSGLAVRSGLDTLAGVIDADYRGEVSVILVNHGDSWATISPGDRIAQIIFKPILPVSQLEIVDSLGDSERGIGGFGSTGD